MGLGVSRWLWRGCGCCLAVMLNVLSATFVVAQDQPQAAQTQSGAQVKQPSLPAHPRELPATGSPATSSSAIVTRPDVVTTPSAAPVATTPAQSEITPAITRPNPAAALASDGVNADVKTNLEADVRSAAGVGAGTATAVAEIDQPLPETQRALLPPQEPPKLPLEPLAAEAYGVLEKHCARCHQAGRLERSRPAKNFGNILHLNQLVRDAALVIPGNPDGSRLYTYMLKREMPYDVYQEFSGGTGPDIAEIQTVRDWITNLATYLPNRASDLANRASVTVTGSQTARSSAAASNDITSDTVAISAASCGAQKHISNQQVASDIAAFLSAAAPSAANDYRFVTLTNLYNSCSSSRELEVYRQAVVKLLNSLSSAPEPLRLTTIDKAETVIPFKLSQLGWNTSHWDKLRAAYPYSMVLAGKPATTGKPQTVSGNTAKPDNKRQIGQVADLLRRQIRADWLVYAASRAPLYYQLLDQPASIKDLEEKLSLDVEANIRGFLATRVGLLDSRVAQNNRLLERHDLNYGKTKGAFWTTYDFTRSRGRQNLLNYPLGPAGDRAFQHRLNMVIYSLPNGFNAFYLSDDEGNRLNTVPEDILHGIVSRDGPVMSGVSCLSCHSLGVLPAKDEVRQEVEDKDQLSTRVIETMRRFYIPQTQMDQLFDQDNDRTRAAMLRANLDPDLTHDGIEVINLLAKRYARNVVLATAAAEFGLTPKALVARLRQKAKRVSSANLAFVLRRRLQQGSVPREQFARIYAKISLILDDAPVSASALAAVAATGNISGHGRNMGITARSFDLALYSDKSVYQHGDVPQFWVRSSRDCNLTVINIDKVGKGTVIFPNDFAQDNAISAGQVLNLPGLDAPYQFRLRDRGSETIVSICNTSADVADGIEFDFEKQKFANLGVYKKFLSDALRNGATSGPSRAKAQHRTRQRRGRRSRNRRQNRADKAIKPEVQARSAVRFEIR